jgi:predicted alpha/beta-hydrolase family hydrolase
MTGYEMEIVIDGPANGPLCIFAHGAGAPMDSDFINTFTNGLVALGIQVARFEFPYMQERRLTGTKRPPNPAPELLACCEEVVKQLSKPCVLIGKSMGGRMASMLASTFEQEIAVNAHIKGVCALGYPFHPQGKPEKLRIDHLSDLAIPMSIVQGERDALGNRKEVEQLFVEQKLPASLSMLWLEDGDHDLKPRKKSGFTHQQHIDEAVEYTASFIKFCLSDRKLNNK